MQDDNVFENELSSPKRKLMQAKQKDQFYDAEMKNSETQEITRCMSELFVEKAINSALKNLPDERK